MMVEKIEELERRFQELEALLSDPAVIGNQPEFRKLSREHADLSDWWRLPALPEGPGGNGREP